MSNIKEKIKELQLQHDELEKKYRDIMELPILDNPKLERIKQLILDKEINNYRAISFPDMPNKEIVLLSLKSLYNTWNEFLAVRDKLTLYRKLNFKRKTYKDILYEYHKRLAINIIKGEVYNLGNHLGKIEVVKKKRNYRDKYNNKIVNWKESLDELIRLAGTKKESDAILKRYEAKEINRKQFIEQMKPFVYSPDTPDLPKWHIYYVDHYYPMFVWHHNNTAVANAQMYSFYPTNHIQIKNEEGKFSQISVSETMTIEEILETDGLGNRDKMNCIFRKDKFYFKEYGHAI